MIKVNLLPTNKDIHPALNQNFAGSYPQPRPSKLTSISLYSPPIHSIKEQSEIVRLLDNLFSNADEIENRYKKFKIADRSVTTSIIGYNV